MCDMHVTDLEICIPTEQNAKSLFLHSSQALVIPKATGFSYPEAPCVKSITVHDSQPGKLPIILCSP